MMTGMKKLAVLWAACLGAVLAWTALAPSRPAALGARAPAAARVPRAAPAGPAGNAADEAAGFNAFQLMSAMPPASPPLSAPLKRPSAR